MTDVAARLETLREVLAGFDGHDLDRILAVFGDDCVFEAPRGPEPWGRRYEGRQAVRDAFAARFEGIPDARYTGRGDFVAGDRGVSEWTLTGTRRDGEVIEVWGCDLWTFDGDKIVRKNSFWKAVER